MSGGRVVIVGGGIVGLATAWRVSRRWPKAKVTLLEKEERLAFHQTGHNSGVMHSGIYYRPGSLRAQNCRRGLLLLREFCRQQGLPHEICGKVIVATGRAELERLHALFERGQANGVACRLIDRHELRRLEPHCDGVQALHVPEAGIIDYQQVCLRLAELFQESGGGIVTGAGVLAVREMGSEVVVTTVRGEFRAERVINCAGLHSDRVTRLSGMVPSVQIVPFRGEYYALKPPFEHFCRNLIYPVPDPEFPFLGVHLTRQVGGGVECGPNAVPAFAREGYRRRDVNWRDLREMWAYRGLRLLARKHWRMGSEELGRSFSKARFTAALQRLIPEIREHHLVETPAGVRAQAVAPDGRMVDDFVIESGPRLTHVVSAPSPAATASLSIAETIVERMK